MENLILSANVVLPLFLLMLTGFCLRRFGVLDENTFKQMNKAVFKANELKIDNFLIVLSLIFQKTKIENTPDVN